MARPRKFGKKPSTTVTISEELRDRICNMKQHSNISINDFLGKILNEYNSLKSNNAVLKTDNDFLFEMNDKTTKKIQEYIEVIDVLKKDKQNLQNELNRLSIGVITVENN